MADLITLEDVTARMGQALNPQQTARVAALIADASAIARMEAPGLDAITDDSVVLRPNGLRLTLPGGPIASITSVSVVGSPDLLLPALAYSFDGVDTIALDAGAGWIINLPESYWDDGAHTYRVVYSHGFTVTPPDVKAVVCNMVIRSLVTPSLSEGLTGENIGQYGWQMNQGTGAGGASIRLTQADLRVLHQPKYRRTAMTLETPIS